MSEIEQVVKALNGIAEAIRQHAAATELLARANAGEFDEQTDDGGLGMGQSLSEVR